MSDSNNLTYYQKSRDMVLSKVKVIIKITMKD